MTSMSELVIILAVSALPIFSCLEDKYLLIEIDAEDSLDGVGRQLPSISSEDGGIKPPVSKSIELEHPNFQPAVPGLASSKPDSTESNVEDNKNDSKYEGAWFQKHKAMHNRVASTTHTTSPEPAKQKITTLETTMDPMHPTASKDKKKNWYKKMKHAMEKRKRLMERKNQGISINCKDQSILS